MKYFRLKEWWSLQHYKDRAPIWIKLYTGDLSDPDSTWARLTDVQRAHLMGIRMLAAKYDNVIPFNGELVGAEIMASDPVDLGAFGDLIEVHESKQACLRAEQAARGQGTAPETGPEPDSKSASRSDSDVDSRSASKTASNVASDYASTRYRDRERRRGGKRAPARARATGSRPPTDDQKILLGEMAVERGVIDERGDSSADEQLEAFVLGLGLPWPMRRQDVTTIRQALEQRPRVQPPDPQQLRRQEAVRADRRARAEREQAAAATWEGIRPLLQGAPETLAAAVCSVTPEPVRELIIRKVGEHLDKAHFAGATSAALGAVSDDLTPDNLPGVLAALHRGRRAWEDELKPYADDPEAMSDFLEAFDDPPVQAVAACWLKLWIAKRAGIDQARLAAAIMESTHGFVLRPDNVAKVYKHLGIAGPPAARGGQEVACGGH